MINNPEKTMTAEIDNILFHSEESGFTVLSLSNVKTNKIHRAVGTIFNPTKGITLDITYIEQIHDKFGLQLAITNYVLRLPSDTQSILKFLSSGAIKGIGPSLANRIIDQLGKEVYDIIENDPERLLEVPGIGKSKLEVIKQSWAMTALLRGVTSLLAGTSLSINMMLKLYKHYGSNTLKVIQTNPYQLIKDIDGIGFRKADEIALKLGFTKDCKARIEAGVLYTIQQNTEFGNTCLNRLELLTAASKTLQNNITTEMIEQSIITLSNDLVIESYMLDGTEIFTLPRVLRAETKIAQFFKTYSTDNAGRYAVDELDNLLIDFQKRADITLSQEQHTAVKNAFLFGTSIITGGPGTGKTTIIRAICYLCECMNLELELAAPTGKAAKRMEEATKREARTIHRLLEFSPEKHNFLRNETNPLEIRMLVIDEVSMVDVSLMYSVIRALTPFCKLVIVGDVDQLPSIGPGSVLRDTIELGYSHTTILTRIYRQSERSHIAINCHLINQGKYPQTSYETLTDFTYRESETPDYTIDLIKRMVEFFVKKLGIDYVISQLQILAPMKKGTCGINNINILMQDLLNKHGEEVKINKKFRVGDRIIQTRNNYNKNIFNGSIGRIVNQSRENDSIQVLFSDSEEIIELDRADTEDLQLAYALTVHKSQGSEYSHVITVLQNEHFIMLNRSLVYTALSRARKHCVLITSKKALGKALKVVMKGRTTNMQLLKQRNILK